MPYFLASKMCLLFLQLPSCQIREQLTNLHPAFCISFFRRNEWSHSHYLNVLAFLTVCQNSYNLCLLSQDRVFVNFDMCSSINFSMILWESSDGNSHITVEICGVCGLRQAVKRTPGALFISSGHLVCKIDSKSSHSSVEGKVLIKIFVCIKELLQIILNEISSNGM